MKNRYTMTCPYCGQPVIVCVVEGEGSVTMENGVVRQLDGIVSDPSYTLVADWVYHSTCWDKQVEEYPP